MDAILVVNAGSSSVKFQIFEASARMTTCEGSSKDRLTVLARGRGCALRRLTDRR